MNSIQSFILGSMHLLDKRNISHVLIGRSTQTQDLNFEGNLQNQKFNKYKKSFSKLLKKFYQTKEKVQNWLKGTGQCTISHSTCNKGIEWVVKEQTRSFLLGWPKLERFAKTNEMV